METATRGLATMDLATEAGAYFTRKHLDVTTQPPASLIAPLQVPLMPTYQCQIGVVAAVFYAYCRVEVDIDGRKYLFEGHAGSVGAGNVNAIGVLYFPKEEWLISTKEFGIAFVAEEGGAVHVTWGNNGSMLLPLESGGGAGVFGGSGEWRRTN